MFRERAEALNPEVGAFLLLLDEPQEELRLESPLKGLPFAVKDIFDVAGLATTGGSRLFPPHKRPHDADIVALLRTKGGRLLGKTHQHELSFGITSVNPHFGPVRNPYRLDHIAGGSSGGSAAAVAAGLVPFALGSDTGGSIRIPSALTGLVGLKPTVGRISTRGMLGLSWTQDTAGPMAPTVRVEMKLLLSAKAFVDGFGGDMDTDSL